VSPSAVLASFHSPHHAFSSPRSSVLPFEPMSPLAMVGVPRDKVRIVSPSKSGALHCTTEYYRYYGSGISMYTGYTGYTGCTRSR
jgi:hypothetical protein